MGNVPDSQADVVRPALPDAIRSPADFAQVIAWFEEVSKPALQEIVAIDE